MGELRIYAHLIRATIRAQAQYRLSFAVDLLGTSLAVTIDLLAILVFFRVARSLAGFPLRQAFLMASLAALGFATADLIAGNVDRLRFNVRTGWLDALLVRPLGLLPQLLAGNFGFRRIGRVAQAGVAYAIALGYAHLAWNPARAALVVVAPLAASAIWRFGVRHYRSTGS